MEFIPDDDSFVTNDLVINIVNILTESKIKLWELEVINDVEQVEKVLSKEIIEKAVKETNLKENDVKQILKRLQKHTLNKLELNKRYNKDGIAIFTIKFIGNRESIIPAKLGYEASVDQSGKEFKENLLKNFELNCNDLKLICNGKVIQDNSSLREQNIKNFSIIMAICIYTKEISEFKDNLNKNSQEYKMIEEIKDAIGLLCDERLNKRNNELMDFNLENQNGIAIDVSKEDRRCLTTAMILHEKGKKFMKKKEYLKALIVLAEADSEFRNCTNKVLIEKIDNYALLNLDIVWCYLSMQNLDDLRDAEERLKLCENCLEKCYGSDLDRLRLLQGGNVSKFTPIFVRLNLLKGIMFYHKGKKTQCKAHLDVSLKELQKNIVDDNKVTELMTMGFSATQARLALKTTGGNIEAAIESIMKNKEMKERNKKLSKEKEYERKMTEKYGLTLKDQKPIDIKVLKDLTQLGYKEERAAKALIQSNNDFNLALDVIKNLFKRKYLKKSYFKILQSQFQDENDETNETVTQQEPNDEMIMQLTSMGYDVELAKLALQAFKSDINKSIDFLISKIKSQGDENLKAITSELQEKLDKIHKQTNKSNENKKKESTEEKNRKRQAEDLISDLASEMPQDDEEYLDFNLDDDLFFINKYYILLNM